MKNIFRTIVMITVGCVLFASTAVARGHHHGGGMGMGGGRGGGMGSGGMDGMGMSGSMKMGGGQAR